MLASVASLQARLVWTVGGFYRQLCIVGAGIVVCDALAGFGMAVRLVISYKCISLTGCWNFFQTRQAVHGQAPRETFFMIEML